MNMEVLYSLAEPEPATRPWCGPWNGGACLPLRGGRAGVP